MTELQFREIINRSLGSHVNFRNRWDKYTFDSSQFVEQSKVESILSSLEERLNNNYPFFHPSYAGQMIKPPHPIAIAAYLMAMQINPNNHALDGGPATAKMEIEVVKEIAEMFGYSEHLGHLTSSGTIANLEALWVARSIHPTKLIAFSSDAHYTHKRMCEVIQASSRVINYDNLELLENELQKGTIGTLVVTIGTTGTGSVEPLHHILPLAKKYGVRVHADCAYGGFFMLLAKDENPIVSPEPFLSLKDCDSIVIDPHKHGLQPYGCGCVLFKDIGVGKFYKHDSPYTYFTSNELHLGEISLECSRAGASAAALWATLQAFPLQSNNGLGTILTKTRQAALKWSEMVSSSSSLLELEKPDLDIVIYLPKTNPFSASVVSQITEKIFSATMNQHKLPVYLATYAVDSASIAKCHPTFIQDSPTTKVLRSVLMKPEHEQFVPELFKNISAIAKTMI
ncbi:MAG: aminotransferase class I/II-fold pyridoxal phosphate-dependent enzyme [Bacteroidota bacterium]|nr:aminotransferase class I/II-fold pyridoxal phosphate-dependent enzyme [Bacteroidota bacterium]